ncbi:MAG TPA: DNA polymerase III subunit beta [Syntrophomonadaceae bacterium]|nr:DNA polymerase III subunit beta [Syntrophomonadaceae bacterium]
MKFMIEKQDLSSITTQVYRAASNKNTIPVLSGLLIQADREKGLTLTATDMEIGIQASTENVDIIEEGQVLVNAHYFADFIKVLPDVRTTVELDKEKAKLKINYGRSSGFINTYREQEYPELPLQKMEFKTNLTHKTLKEALRKTSFAAAQSHFRQVFTGVLFDFTAGNILNVVASDTHRLAYYTCTLPGPELEPFSFIVPTRTVNELLRWLEDSEETIKIELNQNNVVFYQDKLLILSRLIEGQYPNYNQVIPSTWHTEMKMNTHMLTNVLERARVMPTDDKLKIPNVRVEIKENEVVINSFSEVMGEIEEVIDEITISGDNNFKISFNTNYFLDVVKLLAGESEQIEIKLSGSLGPAVIKNPEKDNYLYVLVPLRTGN